MTGDVTRRDDILAPKRSTPGRSLGGEGIVTISAADRTLPQVDLLVSLAQLLHRNRLALVVLAANVGLVGARAREVAAGSAPARWLARNAHAIRLFLASLPLLLRCVPQAGYRAIRAERRPFRRRHAPRLMRICLDRRAAARVRRGESLARRRPYTAGVW